MTAREETLDGHAMSPADLLLGFVGGLTYLLVGSLVAALYLRLLVGEGGRDSDAVMLVILTWPVWLLLGLVVVAFRPFLWLARRLGLGPAKEPRPAEYVPGREPPGLERRKGPPWYWPWGR